MLADDAARERDRAQRTAMFTTALENMKILAEGGTRDPASITNTIHHPPSSHVDGLSTRAALGPRRRSAR